MSDIDTAPERALCDDILTELSRARTKFPGRNVTFAALVEEVCELATAVFSESRERVREEAVQVAVMAMRVILDGDHTYEPWRAEKGLDPLVMFERGDEVLHRPSGETWVVLRAGIDGAGEYVEPAGWPPGRARASDCVLTRKGAHVGMLDRAALAETEGE